MNKDDIIEELNRYFEDYDGHNDLLKNLFLVGYRTVSSNGTMLAFIDGDYTDGVDRKHEALEEVSNDLFKEFEQATFSPFETVDTNINESCKTCKGKGKLFVKECPECEGSGEIEFGNRYNDYQVECDTCCGHKTVKIPGEHGENCHECHGTGETRVKDIRFLGGLINPLQLDMVLQYPDLEVATVEWRGCEQGKFMFKSSNGISVLITGIRG